MGHLAGRDLAYTHGPEVVLAGVSITVGPGDRVGVLGPNGVGKSTLLRLLAGELAPERGSVERHPAELTVGHLAQEPEVVRGETVLGLLARRTGVAGAEDALERAAHDLAVPDGAAPAAHADERYASALDAFMRLGAADLPQRAEGVLDRVGLSGRSEQPVAELSGGQRARAQLAAVLLSRHEILLLDEPTNDLDLDGLALLEEFLEPHPGGLAVVSHDRAFLERIVTSILEIDEHERVGRAFAGGFAAYLHERDVARRHAEDAYVQYTSERERLAANARRHRLWAATGANRAKKRPPDNDKALKKLRMEGAESMAAQASRAERALERLEVVDKPWEGWDLRLRFAEAGRSGDVVASLAGAVVHRGSFTLGPVDLAVYVGDRVVVTGANGSGKTTLLEALLGERPLDAGMQRLGTRVRVGRLDQSRVTAGNEPLLDAFCADTGTTRQAARSMLAKVGLGASHVGRPASQLSPGERTRAALAGFAVRGVNVLVLDEPTNHLDLPAVEQLEAALEGFGATVLLVSHDRRLLERVRATRGIEVVDGRVRER